MQYICTACGYMGKAKNITKGNILVELILWCIFLIPGLIYSIWRLSSRHKGGCPKCGNETMIPTNTPVGTDLIKKYHPTK